MMKKNKALYLAILVFIIAFMWGLFFTYGFDFFWEDFAWFHLDKEENPIKVDFSTRFTEGIKILGNFFKDFFDYHRLFQVGFGACHIQDRPYLFYTNDFLSILFTDKAILYRIFKAFIFSVYASLLYLLINRVSLKLALAGAFLYITSSEMWVNIAYACDPGICSQLAELVSILLFLHLLEKKPLQTKHLWLCYFAILVASNYAILTKSNGRYLAVSFILTLIFFKRKELKFHAPMLTGLLLLQVPVLGYIKKAFTGLPASPINIASHNARPISESLKEIINNFKYPKNALGRPLLILLGIIILLHLLNVIFKKNGRYFIKEAKNNRYLKERTFLFMVWFIFSFIMIALSRSFSYSGPYDWVVMEASFFVGPFIIFLCYYAYMIASRLRNPFQTVFITLCLLLMFGQLWVNVPRINRFRGGWGNYFCAWKNTEKYIDSQSNHAIVFTASEMFYKPFVFRNSDNKVRNNVPGSHNLKFVEKMFIEEGYHDIFLARRFKPEVEGESEKVVLKDIKVIDGDTGDLYDRIKRFIGRPSVPVIHVCHYKYKEE